MSQERIETNKAPLIQVDACHGDLVIRSWSETAVSIQSDNYEANETEAGLSLTSYSNMKLIVPTNASLNLGHVRGNLTVNQVNGNLSVQTADGNVTMVGSNQVKLNTVNGNLSAKQLEGDFSVETINGNATWYQVKTVNAGTTNGNLSVHFAQGAVNLQKTNGNIYLQGIDGAVTVTNRVNGNLSASQIEGTLNLSHIHGNIRLNGPLPKGDHTCIAHGDITLRWPADAPVLINATAAAIKNRLPLQDVVEEAGRLNGRLQNGGPVLNLEAKGRIELKEAQFGKDEWRQESGDDWGFGDWSGFGEGFAFGFDFVDLGDRISREVELNINRLTTEIQNKFGPDFGEKMAEKFARKAEQAAAKAEQAADRVQQRSERQQARQTRWAPPPPKPTTPPKPKSSPEEQIKILKMVEQGTISPEEANTLLQALES